MDEPRRLYRSETDRMLAGVCGGLGEFFGVDPTLIRIGFIVLALAGGAGLPIYLAMWVVVPRASRVGSPGIDVARDAADEVRDTVQKGAEQAKQAYERWRRDRDAAATDGASDGATVPPPPSGDVPGGTAADAPADTGAADAPADTAADTAGDSAADASADSAADERP